MYFKGSLRLYNENVAHGILTRRQETSVFPTQSITPTSSFLHAQGNLFDEFHQRDECHPVIIKNKEKKKKKRGKKNFGKRNL